MPRLTGGTPPRLEVEPRLVAETDDRERLTARALERQYVRLPFTAAKARRGDRALERRSADAARERAQIPAILLTRRHRNDHDVGRDRGRVPATHSDFHRVASTGFPPPRQFRFRGLRECGGPRPGCSAMVSR